MTIRTIRKRIKTEIERNEKVITAHRKQYGKCFENCQTLNIYRGRYDILRWLSQMLDGRKRSEDLSSLD